MTHRIRVLILIPHLGGGGAEQVTALLARGLSREKYELHLGLVTQREASAHQLPAGVRIHLLGAVRVRHGAFRLVRLVRNVRPQVILSGMAHLNFLVLLLRPMFPRGTKMLVRQNATVSAALNSATSSRGTRLLYKLLYRRADRVICQSRAMAEDLAKELNICQEKISVLPNPVDIEGVLAAASAESKWTGPGPHLLAVGRLSHEKGLDLLLNAMANVRAQFSTADLIIVGSGSEEAALKSQSRSLGLESAVRFVGYVENPYAYLRGTTVFVLPSRHEGMPNALLEAAVGGLPIVAMPASGGVVDLLQRLDGAWLAEDISAAALTNALTKALQSFPFGKRFERIHPSGHSASQENSESSPFGSADEFGFERALDMYEKLIDTACIVRPV